MSQLNIYITAAWLCLILCMVRRRGRMRHKQSSWILLPKAWVAARFNCLMSLSLSAKWLNSPVAFWMWLKDQTLYSHSCGTHTYHTSFCTAWTSMCRKRVSFMFMLSISSRAKRSVSDWKEIIVIAALSHLTSYESSLASTNLTQIFNDIIS